MLNKLDQYFDFNTQALKLRSYRQQLLASNIANADTPNYKAVDIDFAHELKRVSGQQPGALRMAATSQGHMQAATGNPYNAKIMYRNISQPNIDGNTVNMDEERAHFAENALRYETTTRMLNGQIKGLMAAIQSR